MILTRGRSCRVDEVESSCHRNGDARGKGGLTMDPATEQVYQAVLALPDDQRLELVEALLASEDWSSEPPFAAATLQEIRQGLVCGPGAGSAPPGRSDVWLTLAPTPRRRRNMSTPWAESCRS